MRSHPLLFGVSLTLFSLPAFAGDNDNTSLTVLIGISAALVFLMQAGFALLESGMVRAKNTVNVILKNLSDVAIGSLGFWLIGFGLMFGENPTGLFGTDGFAPDAAEIDPVMFFYQVMFAATAATIVSGAVAERMRFWAYLLASVVITVAIYPVFGSWVWGGSAEGGLGWLSQMGFIDFAGSTVVHSVGAWVALAAVMVLGPRVGRFGLDGKAREIRGHSQPFVALGGFILWFGWFGFNGGSVTSLDLLGPVLMNTQLAASAGVIGGLIGSAWAGSGVRTGHLVNGALGGLVAITAGAATMSPVFAVVTGLLGGLVAVRGADVLVRYGIDDVVGAIPVHGFSGAWGTFAAGVFYNGSLFDIERVSVQLIGIGSAFLWAFGLSWVLFTVLKKRAVLRASTLHEQRGLDVTEHVEVGYGDFQQVTTHAEVSR